MLKLQREKSKQPYPAGSRASFQKCSMGLQKSGADTENEGRNVLACACSFVRERGRACVDVFVCGPAGAGKQPVGRALAAPPGRHAGSQPAAPSWVDGSAE